MDIKRVLKHNAFQNVPLGYDEAYELGCAAVAACAEDADPMLRIQTVTALSALHTKATYQYRGDGVSTPESAAEQIAGICAAIFENDIAKSRFGFARPKVPYVMDNCGMGGDLITTANVSTIAALIAATAGINMCKHGSPGNTDRVGSSDFVGLLGINPYMSRKSAEQAVERYHFGYTEALDTRFKHIHLQTHKHAGLPHMNDVIGPITNPIDPKLMTRRVIGVNHLIDPEVIAKAYQILNHKGVTDVQHLIAVRGYADPSHQNGMDEYSICHGGSKLAILEGEDLSVHRVGAEYFGLEAVSVEQIGPPKGMSKGDFSLGILDGSVTGAACEMVFANAALLFMLDQQLLPRKAYEAVCDTFSTGEVQRLIEQVCPVSFGGGEMWRVQCGVVC